ncbi:hypothetical protein Bca4012_030419 [Brassica carinata]
MKVKRDFLFLSLYMPNETLAKHLFHCKIKLSSLGYGSLFMVTSSLRQKVLICFRGVATYEVSNVSKSSFTYCSCSYSWWCLPWNC